jgi:hypothetical protein
VLSLRNSSHEIPKATDLDCAKETNERDGEGLPWGELILLHMAPLLGFGHVVMTLMNLPTLPRVIVYSAMGLALLAHAIIAVSRQRLSWLSAVSGTLCIILALQSTEPLKADLRLAFSSFLCALFLISWVLTSSKGNKLIVALVIGAMLQCVLLE